MSKPAVLVLAVLLLSLLPCAALTKAGGARAGAPRVTGYFAPAPLDDPATRARTGPADRPR
ncbi:hypothetical protein [Kitasatospora sp. NPDC093806]|uniref:hypothetical protein n=1 Tax=Kitasatospora sp. NPDC093806 TaxID=3155075 RepID=UPI003428169A